MIDIRVEVESPWQRDFFRNLGSKSGRIGAHKHWEIEHTYFSDRLLDVELKVTSEQDHPGVRLGLGVLGYGISARIYDDRHWNAEKQTLE